MHHCDGLCIAGFIFSSLFHRMHFSLCSRTLSQWRAASDGIGGVCQPIERDAESRNCSTSLDVMNSFSQLNHFRKDEPVQLVHLI
jgi:hypothetical protein